MPVVTKKPGRWDHPFDPELAEAEVARILALEPWAAMEQEKPGKLKKLIGHDARIVRKSRGEIIVRQGDHGNSAFFIARGSVRVVVGGATGGLSHAEEGKHEPVRPGLFRSLAQLWRNRREPEARDDPKELLTLSNSAGDEYVPIILGDVDAVLDKHRTALLEQGAIFGEIAALGRTPRTATLFAAEDDTELLEIRWQGLRDLRKAFSGFREHVDELFRTRALRQHLRATAIFARVGDTEQIRAQVKEQRFGDLFLGSLGYGLPRQPAVRVRVGEESYELEPLAESRKRNGAPLVEVYTCGSDPGTAERRGGIAKRVGDKRDCHAIVIYSQGASGVGGGCVWQWMMTEPDEPDQPRVPRECRQLPSGEARELFDHLIPALCFEEIAKQAELQSHGTFEWARKATRPEEEPIIAGEGQYPNGVLLVRCGFARLTCRVNGIEQTVSYLGPGHAYGFEEIAHNWKNPQESVSLQSTLRALGYVDLVVIPTAVIDRFVLPSLPGRDVPEITNPAPPGGVGPLDVMRGDDGVERDMIEFLVDNRFTNATAAMVIDLDRCTRCDDCVRGCASAHDDNPRFIRHGPVHDRFMIANACMHCADPVCMIGCPTGAISRESLGGEVVINDKTCIGCATCSNNCPYHNIRMVETRSEDGRQFVGERGKPLLKATKCDLCLDQLGGPACQRACPHDALERISLNDVESLAQWSRR